MVRGRSYISEYNLGSLCSSQCNIVINGADPPLIHVIVIILADDHPDDNRHLLDGGLIVGNRPNSTSNGRTLLELVLIWWDLGGYEDMSGDIWGCKDMKFIFIWNPRAFEGNIIFLALIKTFHIQQWLNTRQTLYCQLQHFFENGRTRLLLVLE